VREECKTHERYENCTAMLVGRPQGKNRLGRSRGRWEDNIFYPVKIGCEDVHWEKKSFSGYGPRADLRVHGNEMSRVPLGQGISR
jgi:hypothetical protein